VIGSDAVIDRNRCVEVGGAIAFVAVCAPKNIDYDPALSRPFEFILQLRECIFPQECRVHDESGTGLT